ncbi:polyadenylate-binding protein 1-like [Tachysurus ichikawai]
MLLTVLANLDTGSFFSQSESAVPAPAQKPLTIYMLESADLDEQIRMLYEYIFPLVEKSHPTAAKHITRLVIEGENNYDLVNLIAEPNRLHAHVEQIAAVLRAREVGQDVHFPSLKKKRTRRKNI